MEHGNWSGNEKKKTGGMAKVLNAGGAVAKFIPIIGKYLLPQKKLLTHFERLPTPILRIFFHTT